MVLGAALGLGAWPAPAQAKTAGAEVEAEAQIPSTGVFPGPAWLDDLRAKLTVPPDCLPQCADVAQLSVQAQAGRLQLRMQIDALANVEVPLPGLGVKGLPQSVLMDGQAPALRRDGQGQLWIALSAGVHQVVLDADVGEATQVDIALPMPVRALAVQAPGWTVSGIDPRGLATGALSLSRSGSAKAAGGAEAASSDALPPFVQVTRVLQLGLHWQVHTRVQRIGPSRAPVSVRIALLAGEAVNDERVRTQDGFAVLSLGADREAAFVSTVKEADELMWVSTDAPNQIEHWQLAPSSQWHVRWSGIAPVRYVDEVSRLQPLWQPWPGEEVSMHISRPQGVPGQTLTFDRLHLQVRPGMRATDMNVQLHVRASQGGQHVIDLPSGAMFEGVTIDGQDQPLQPQGQQLTMPITPGAHEWTLRWREPRGMGWRFESAAPDLNANGVNASTQLHMPAQRVLLALGGPRLGPAILLWGVLAVWIGLAIFLGRSRLTPLGAATWAVLGLGLMQTSVLSAAAVVAWFALLAARARGFGRATGTLAGWHPYAANGLQVLLLLWTLVAALCLLNAIRVGLLGYPDMMVTGNGSSAQVLNWYQDRFSDQPQPVWAVSVPVLAYRILMLLWALWLAVSVLKWVKWAWACFSAGGYWYRKSAVLGAHSQGPTSG
ncbi:MAG TPA: hypothetical protein PLQ67_04060, partial [Burkholderiaceae bacterium]|nr:hypothetical protein [Burkholderiaceae bacterium]